MRSTSGQLQVPSHTTFVFLVGAIFGQYRSEFCCMLSCPRGTWVGKSVRTGKQPSEEGHACLRAD